MSNTTRLTNYILELLPNKISSQWYNIHLSCKEMIKSFVPINPFKRTYKITLIPYLYFYNIINFFYLIRIMI